MAHRTHPIIQHDVGPISVPDSSRDPSLHHLPDSGPAFVRIHQRNPRDGWINDLFPAAVEAPDSRVECGNGLVLVVARTNHRSFGHLCHLGEPPGDLGLPAVCNVLVPHRHFGRGVPQPIHELARGRAGLGGHDGPRVAHVV